MISAPSGTGKTTLVNRLLAETPHLLRSVSVTTRKRRRGEQDGRDYNFITRKKFGELKRNGDFLSGRRFLEIFTARLARAYTKISRTAATYCSR